MTRVLMVVAEMGAGGAEAVVADLARDVLARAGDVTVASGGGWRADALGAAGARLCRLPLPGRSPARLVRSAATLRREMRARRYDLVHAHNVKAALVARAALTAQRERPPLLVTLHGLPDGDYAVAAFVLARVANRVVAVSADVERRLVAAGFPAERISVVHNAVSAPDVRPRAQARAELGLPPDAPVAVCVARLVPQKRQDLLVTAWAQLPADAILVLAGDGPTRPRLEAQIASSGCADRIRVLGERYDVDRLLAAADVCVLPSDWEGLPISVLEAMAAGVPVVASAVGDLATTLAAAVLSVQPGSADALAAGLGEVLTDPARRAALAAAGAELVRTRFALSGLLGGYREEYARVGTPAEACRR